MAGHLRGVREVCAAGDASFAVRGRLLAAAGTDKSKILAAQVWLADMGMFFAHNEEWNAWVDPENPPVRACVEARLAHPQLLVEVMVTAAR
jgi:enamine deaminase RidA (YjgF/YER057c/UK114 family)